MDFIEQLQQLSTKIPRLCEMLQTEEATKNALIMPFIGILGYDVFDPTEVVPELVADIGTKKGEKVDYAIQKDGRTIMLWECKHCGGDLSLNHASQLFRYFTVTDARIAVLTNGITYRFFTDLEAPNKMDEKPFLEIDMLNLNEASVAELRKLSKPAFDIDAILSVAGELKYTREIKRILQEQSQSPSDELLKFFASQLQMGILTSARKEKLSDAFRHGFKGYVNDQLNDRLKTALGGSTPVSLPQSAEDLDSPEIKRDDGVVTTEEEIEAFYVVKSVLRCHVAPERIVARDKQSYFGILLDDNNRKPLVRLHFNNKTQKYIGVFDSNRQETRTPINNLNDIYNLADEIIRVLDFYEQPKSAQENIEKEGHP